MSFAVDVDNGPSTSMWVRVAGLAPAGLTASLSGIWPAPSPYGRIGGADTVTLGSGKRRMYSAVPYTFTGPTYSGGVQNPENAFCNVANFISVTQDSFK
jgi:hypothetical protein